MSRVEWNLDLFISTVVQSLDIERAQYREDLALGEVPHWDSVGHLGLVNAIESTFGIQFPMEEIPELGSVEKLQAAVKKRLGAT